jgi:hypothetical protein
VIWLNVFVGRPHLGGGVFDVVVPITCGKFFLHLRVLLVRERSARREKRKFATLSFGHIVSVNA